MSVAASDPVVPNRAAIVLCLLTATIMNTLDTTIANVALPHIQGSVSASADQITWVLTSYIVASAVMTPMTGWITGRLGVRLVLTLAVAGFTLASALCGLAQSLFQIVAFRGLQGVCGAALVPLGQAVMLDIYPPRDHARAMALIGMGAMVGPIMGPALGGWLTENYSWRWVFYINVPFGILTALGFSLLLPRVTRAERRRLDFVGFATLSLGIAALQLMLDRGQQLDWFSSTEIWIELSLAVLGFWWATVQTLTAEHPFVPREVFADRNFILCSLLGFLLNVLLFATLSLLPPMLENLMGYPVSTTGIVTAPRGFGTLLSMFVVGRLLGRVDARVIIIIGLCLAAFAMWIMTHINLQMGPGLVVAAGLVQGVGVGLIFVSLSTVVYSTLPPMLRTDAAGIFILVRNIGSSIGISILEALLISNTQVVHADLIAHVRPDNPNLQLYGPAGWSLTSQVGRAVIDASVSAQALMVAYADSFKLMLGVAVLAMPLVLFMRPSRGPPAAGELHAAD